MQKSLEIISKVLSAENLKVEYRNTSTASFDVVTRTLTLPIWEKFSPDVLEMFVLHEVGHALYTPADGFRLFDKNIFSIVNVIEDARIERLMKVKYPGSAKLFSRAYTELHQTLNYDSADFSMASMVDRLNVFFKFYHTTFIRLNEVERSFATRTMAAETFEEVVAIAKDISEYLKNLKKKAPPLPDLTTPEMVSNPDTQFADDGGTSIEEVPAGAPDSEEEESTEETPGGSASSEKVEEQEKADTESESGQSKTSEESEDKPDDNQQSGSSSEDAKQPEETSSPANLEKAKEDPEEPVESQTQKEIEQLQKDAINTKVKNTFYISFDENYAEVEKYVIPYKAIMANVSMGLDMGEVKKRSLRFRNLTKKQVDLMVQNFQLKKSAERYALRERSDSGRLDVSKLAQYQVREDIFRKYTTEKKGKSHGVIVLLDWSGSMASGGVFENALNQCIQLAQFCREVSIPYRILGFRQGGFDYETIRTTTGAFGGQFSLLEILSSEMSTKEHQNMVGLLSFTRHFARNYSLQSTPLLPALLYMRKFIPEFQAKTGVEKTVVITFTDGGNTSEEQNITRNVHTSQNRFTIRDEKTSRTYPHRRIAVGDYDKANGLYSNDPNGSVVTAMNILRDRYGVKVIGIYIAKNTPYFGDLVKEHGFPDDESKYKKFLEEYKKNGVGRAYNVAGRDALFAVRSINLVTSEFDPASEIKEDGSAADIARQIRKSAGTSLKSKVLIERFIESIA